MKWSSDGIEMVKQSAASNVRTTSDLVAEARELQAQHAPRVIGAAASRLRSALSDLVFRPRALRGPQAAAR